MKRLLQNHWANFHWKLKTIHVFFCPVLPPIKGRAQYSMLHCIQIFTNACEATMQVKRAIGKLRPYYLNYQYTTNTCACVEPPHYYAWYVVCFPIVVIALLHGFDPYKTFYLCCKCATFLCPRTSRNAMKCSIEIYLFFRAQKTFMNSLQL